MWNLSEEKEALLRCLCEAYAPTSHEMGIQKKLASCFHEIGIDCEGDSIGNLYASINEDAGFKVAIIAHADEICMQITEITSQGLLRFRKLGGLKATSLIGHKVVILSQKGVIEGIVGCDPLLNNETEAGLLVKTTDLWIDLGADSREECSAMVDVGDFVVFKSDYTLLGKNRIASKALDDRLGTFVMFQAMKLLKNEALTLGVTGISTVQEEIRLRGAAACRKHFDVAIIVDVDFATDLPIEHSGRGSLELGKGLGINLNADSNPVLLGILKKLMKEKRILMQTTLGRSISGGTDATQLQINGNIATLNINIPLRYMHSHYEVCDKRDIVSVIEVIIELIKYIDNNGIRNFVPWQQQ